MRLIEIRNDPLAHFLPTKVTPNGTFFCAAPPGLAPELAELFMRPLNGAPAKRRAGSPGKSPRKRARLDASVNGDDEVEQARRASLAPSGLGSDILGRGSMGPDMGLDLLPNQSGDFDDFQLDVGDFQQAGDLALDGRAKSAAPSALSRLSTPGPDGLLMDDMDESYADATCPIASFDARPMTQTQGTDKEMDREVEVSNADGKGYSKNTVKALSIIRRDLKPIDGDDNEEKVLSFRKMADKVCFGYFTLFLDVDTVS